MISLSVLIDKHTEAVERELMSIGERLRYLGTDRLTWWDLKVVVSQADRRSPIIRATDPDKYYWGVQEQLLAELTDTVHWLQWSKTKDAQKKFPTNMPEKIPRPGVESNQKKSEKFDILPSDEMLEWLGWDIPSC